MQLRAHSSGLNTIIELLNADGKMFAQVAPVVDNDVVGRR